MVAGMLLASTCWAGVPVASTSTLWADPDTTKLSDTTTVYIIVRDVYGEPIRDLECFFYSDRVGVDFFVGSPDTTDIDGLAQARLGSNQFNFWPNVPQVAHITVDCEGVVIGPISVYWLCRAGVDGRPGDALALYQSTPNPFRGSTEIGYALPKPGTVSLEIYDVTGKQVRTLVRGSIEPGNHSVRWDARDGSGRAVPPGVYYVRMTSPGFDETRSVIVLK
jgi:hypothetical protein